MLHYLCCFFSFVGHDYPDTRPYFKWFLVLDQIVGATLKPVLLADSCLLFGCQDIKNWFRIRHQLQTGPWTALVKERYESVYLMMRIPDATLLAQLIYVLYLYALNFISC